MSFRGTSAGRVPRNPQLSDPSSPDTDGAPRGDKVVALGDRRSRFLLGMTGLLAALLLSLGTIRSPPVPPARDRRRELRLSQRHDAPQPRQRPRPRRLPRPRPAGPRLAGDARLAARGLPRLRRAGLGDEGRGDRLGGPPGLLAVLVGREGGRARREAARRLGLGLRLEPDEPPRAAEERAQHHARAGGGPRRAPRLGAHRVGERRPGGGHHRRHPERPARGGGRRASAATRPRSARGSS